MITEIYALKDTKISFKAPFLQHSRAVAMRTAKWIANEKEPQEIEDNELWYLGTYNDDIGVIMPEQPEFVCKLEDLRTKKEA